MTTVKLPRSKAEIDKDLYTAYAQLGELEYRVKVFQSQVTSLSQKISELHSEVPIKEEAKVVEAEVVG